MLFGADLCSLVEHGADWCQFFLEFKQKIAIIRYFKSNLSLIVLVNIVLNRTVVVDSG